MKHPGIAVAAVLFVVSGATAQTDNSSPPDWITTSNRPCKVWNPEPQPDESVTWSGECQDGFASGKGVLRWTVNGQLDVIFVGEYENGKRNGHGVLITADGDRIEGDWVNDKLLPDKRDTI
jgi:MORN repeat protein